MAKISKRIQAIMTKFKPGKIYAFPEAIQILQETSSVKFNESVDVAINLGIDPKKSDQAVRGASVMPNGIGRVQRVAVLTQGPSAEAARNAGADIVGLEDLVESIKAGNIDFDILIATPDTMRFLGVLGPILGPRGLMPNPKVGTVTVDVTKAVTNAKAGQVNFRADKSGIVHCTIGKLDFTSEKLQQNLQVLISDIRKLKPNTSKGIYFKKVTLNSTMGPGLPIEHTSFVS